MPRVRQDPLDILAVQDDSRIAELVPIRHGRLAATPFTFYRGGAAIMASDLSQTPTTDIRAQLCGDAHLSNFGMFRGPDRRLVFDLYDFDETIPGPFEWDVKRLAASVTIAGRRARFPVEGDSGSHPRVAWPATARRWPSPRLGRRSTTSTIGSRSTSCWRRSTNGFGSGR